ncbi:unnamed protein product [Thelazia callipaeda]|uniref:Anoctamin n=1 Tax=Thelazia callipaeda TaxID=103827 RepID=A0A0N5CJJ1_THECL|nr:unnamed protein product [Thelazia callipaeda]
MNVLLVPHAFEMCSVIIVMLVLLIWPIYICREMKDSELEEALKNDRQCARQMNRHLELMKSDAVIEFFQSSQNSSHNITQLNIRHDFYYRKHGVNKLCFFLRFQEKFGIGHEQLGSAHLLVPIVGTIVTLLFLFTHILELSNNSRDSSVTVQLFCGLACWLIISITITIIKWQWKGSKEPPKNLGAAFPLEWGICKFLSWFWIIIKFDQPLTLTMVDFPANNRTNREHFPISEM